ncbi:MAG: HAMP domain-containing sensor histidine kinase, partial [Chthoniobacteraceae bacterium]
AGRAAAPPPDAAVAATPAPAEPQPGAKKAGKLLAELDAPPGDRAGSVEFRMVQPQQVFEQQERGLVSNLAPATATWNALTTGQSEGILTRFVQDKLALILWMRPAQSSGVIFGCVIDAADLADLWPPIMAARDGGYAAEFVIALLDDRARPVATSPPAENGREWKRPFVASEIGEALPHWEAALYLMRPEQLSESALSLRRTLVFLIVAMLGAIALGGWLVVADARRQLALAQQKTDFVSNVSHELKTPLTSIRMFAELMLGGRAEGAKTPQYLRIIMVEAERLTRLINNVLDFARLERRQKRFDKKSLDLHALIARVWEGQELHLRESGFATKWEAAPPPYRVTGDDDALAQILVNLLSNAEKYSGASKEIELHSYLDDTHVCVSVLDRGPGVPAGSERKIFAAFYRAHDSLSSGIQGSGLGLTLAQRLAQEHDGEIEYRPREGGGSAFTLRLPMSPMSPMRPM